MSEQVITSKKSKIIYYVNSAIVFILLFGIGSLPPFGQITPLGMQILGVFVAVLYGWCTVSLIWPSLLAFIAIGSTEYCTVAEAFSEGFGSDIPLIIASVYVLAAYLEEKGVSRYIANWFISRNIGEGRPWVFTILIFTAAYVMSALVSTYATIIILWTIFYNVCDTIGEKRKSKYTGMVIAGIVVTCGLTGMIFPFKPFSLIMLGLMGKGAGFAIDYNFMTWTIYNVIITVALVTVYLLIGRFIVRPDMSKIKEAGKNFAHLRNDKMNKEQKYATGILGLFMAMLIIPSVLPKTIPGMAWLNNVGVIGAVTICMILLAIIKNKAGEPMVNVPRLIGRGVGWELIILVSATMPLCNALEAAEAGVLTTVIAWLTATFSTLTPFMFLVAFVALFLITTQFTHNLVLMLVLTPILVKMGVGFGVQPLLVGMLIYYTAMTAYLTPAASSNAALIFGNTEWVATKDGYFWGAATLISAFIVLLCLGIPLGYLLF